ncbi:6-phosphogluconolactonase [Burkholderia stabilis]|uniref:6-phosphogluconolactonase n=1 Tax=Burkholderia stabilis TaxID=95485 RepID=A0AAJ5NAQ9_9BURK|nr:6-phosphogluconolactonase [Burkholderia stabilis]VBB11417.1 6-phosphogluconolactonase,glucosamine-6-phospha te deaminase,6-phosphogluconolactonase,Glucosamine-6-phospha te isomerases/6-phosphogluconolactonase [Burkholderia stabilis]HDR9585048.1 6-phosphogluconolactonase [Burkholderia stabilis]HDR9648609.1 6-phosphogluconolactonase [Burkholderia stabilis]HDR9654463.1 6-phosphogluconolactonase [Burkholderia stabilis]HDR9678329.1 6-phosphogluconolactonase [Burkholderia stabilis]
MIEIHAFDTQEAQSEALARAVGDALRTALASPARPTLAVSGGTSPRPFLQTLSHAALDWAGVDVTLVDDRWVPEGDSASNAHLVRDTLLQHAAAPARFLPLVDTRAALDAHVAALNANADYRVPNVAVLGMGEDGHTASIFADAPEWDHAITTPERFVAVHPGAAPHARVSFSLDALKRVDRLFLLIAGPAKRNVLDAAAASLQKNAISQLANDKGTQLDVYWCAK